jgi:alpha-beta hydrolase superfamily lysophospholipase
MTSRSSVSLDSRLSLSAHAESFRLRLSSPHVHGYAWRHTSPFAAVVLVHGLQSHAQWFAEAGGILHSRGVSVYAIDRRGSGSSPAETGHIGRWEEWRDEVIDAVAHARTEAGVPVHVLGHCFGANLALAAALASPGIVASVIMLTPGLYVLPGYSPAEKAGILMSSFTGGLARFRVPQDDALFTRDPEVVAWIRADRLGARTLTAHTLLEIRRMLRELRRHTGELAVPLLVFEAARDRISDNRRNRRFLDRSLGARYRRITFDAEHFLLAEPCRDEVLGQLVDWMRREES